MTFFTLYITITGVIIGSIFFLVYKRHLKKNNVVKEKSFTLNAPKIFGTINIIIAFVFLVWYILDPEAFSASVVIENKFLFILSSIFFMYFYILAIPLSIASAFSSIILKKNEYISGIKFAYYISTNVIAAIILFIISYLVSGKTGG
jgi:hypothetical protein